MLAKIELQPSSLAFPTRKIGAKSPPGMNAQDAYNASQACAARSPVPPISFPILILLNSSKNSARPREKSRGALLTDLRLAARLHNYFGGFCCVKISQGSNISKLFSFSNARLLLRFCIKINNFSSRVFVLFYLFVWLVKCLIFPPPISLINPPMINSSGQHAKMLRKGVVI